MYVFDLGDYFSGLYYGVFSGPTKDEAAYSGYAVGQQIRDDAITAGYCGGIVLAGGACVALAMENPRAAFYLAEAGEDLYSCYYLGDPISCYYAGTGPLDTVVDGPNDAYRVYDHLGNRLSRYWDMNPISRGKAIEKHLASTDYSGWFNIGSLHQGTFPLHCCPK